MIEEWREIDGYNSMYRVSNLGRIQSAWSGDWKDMKGSKDAKGYLTVSLTYKKGKFKTCKVHQLVAMAFLNHTPCGMKRIVDHIDNDRLNNRVDNLQLTDNRTNCSKDKKSLSSLRGAQFHTQTGRWTSQIYIDGVHKYLGIFDTELEASKAYEKALRELY